MQKHYGTDLVSLAREYDLQVDGLATFLDLPRPYDAGAELSASDEAWMRDVLDHTGPDGVYRGTNA